MEDAREITGRSSALDDLRDNLDGEVAAAFATGPRRANGGVGRVFQEFFRPGVSECYPCVLRGNPDLCFQECISLNRTIATRSDSRSRTGLNGDGSLAQVDDIPDAEWATLHRIALSMSLIAQGVRLGEQRGRDQPGWLCWGGSAAVRRKGDSHSFPDSALPTVARADHTRRAP